MQETPIIYLLCGLPGSGKTTYAKKLEDENIIRLTLDRELFKRFGHNFPQEKYSEYEQQTKDEIKAEAEKLVKEGRSVIIDFGFWKKKDRDRYREWAESLGAMPKILYFKTNNDELIKRVSGRNTNLDDQTHHIPEGLMQKFISEFEAPSGEGEVVIET